MKRGVMTLLFLSALLITACTEQAGPRTVPQIDITVPGYPEPPEYEPPPTAPYGNTVVEIKVDATSFEFLPSEINAEQGDIVKLVITATDTDHSFTMPAYGIDELLPRGEDTVIQILAEKKGTYTFYSNTPSDKNNDMKGQLIVK